MFKKFASTLVNKIKGITKDIYFDLLILNINKKFGFNLNVENQK